MSKDDVLKLFGSGVPLVLAEVVGQKLNVGANVNRETGKTEQYAGVSTTLILGDDVATFRSYARDEAAVALYHRAEAGDAAARREVLTLKRGDRIAIKIYSLTREKGSTKISGDIIPLELKPA